MYKVVSVREQTKKRKIIKKKYKNVCKMLGKLENDFELINEELTDIYEMTDFPDVAKNGDSIMTRFEEVFNTAILGMINRCEEKVGISK